MRPDESFNKGILSCQFMFICFGFFQGNFATQIIYQLFQGRLDGYAKTANYLQPILLTAGSIMGAILLMFGRRRCALLADIPIAGMGILTLFMDSATLFIARMVNDFVRGALLIIYLVYFKEMMPKRYAGLTICLMLFVSIFCLGVLTLIELVLDLAGISLDDLDSKSTLIARGIVFAGILMCELHFSAALFVLQGESPRYLMEAQRKGEAYAIISLIYKNKDSAKDEMDFIQEASEYRQYKTISWSTLWSSKGRKALLICCALMFLRYATGNLAFWSFLKVDTTEGVSILLAIYFANCIAALLAGIFFNRLNIRTCILCGLAFNAVVNALGLIFGSFSADPGTSNYYLAVLFTAMSSVCSNFTISPISFLLTVQLLPDKGIALSVVFTWISMFLILVPYSLKNPEINQYLYMQPVYICASVLGLVLCYFYIKSSKGSSETELKKTYIESEN